jgi:peptide deformylase
MRNLVYFFLLSILSSCASSFSFHDKEIIYAPLSVKILQINQKEDSLILRNPSSDIKKIKNNKDLTALIEKLRITMKEIGVGIAAPQIGINKNVFLFTRLDKPGHPVEAVINPKIVSHPEQTFCFQNDGCLSVPFGYGNSVRYAWIEVEYENEKGETVREKLLGGGRAEDYTGIIFQHEYDHIRGKLYIDKLCENQ